MALKYHPDRLLVKDPKMSKLKKAQAEEVFKSINNAYAVLIKKQKR